ncbi:hypothetical protein [Agarilytica rhodophyticola]|uniref:hypothetical protein n=1 Tax=Agarilytica rhodophyticola TaxID=1737490 RepID=UPI000B345E65|nr:hypothetical protein [Agarilytica rhodophyticola]
MRNKKSTATPVLLATLLGLSMYSNADELTADASEYPSTTKVSKHAIGTSLNNFGLGLFYTYKFNDNLHIRATAHGLSASLDDVEYSDTDYDGNDDSQAAGIMLDWYPVSKGWQRNIFISGGLMYFDTEFEGSSSARLNDVVSIGNTSFINTRTSALNLKVEHESQVTPYFGIGWGNKSRKERGFSFVTELGFIYMDDPKVTLTSNVSTTVLDSVELERERNDIIDEESGIFLFGSVGVSYHF